MTRQIPHLTPVAAAAVLSLLLLSGCATEKALLTQTQPLQDRIDRVEQNLATSSEAGLRSIENRAQELARQKAELARQLASVQVGLDKLGDQIKLNESRLLQSQAGLEEQDVNLNTRIGGLEKRMDQTTAQVQSALSDLAGLQTRQMQMAATDSAMSDRLAGIEQRIETGAHQMREVADEVANNAASKVANEVTKQTKALQTRQDIADRYATQNDAELKQRLLAAEKKLDSVSALVQEALALAAKEIFLANGKEAFTVLLTDDKVLYPQNDPNLDPKDVAKLNQLAANLTKLDQEYHLDIQGHTANNSTDDNNYSLGKARAEVVKRHLHEKLGISINRMSTISYGANKPLNDSNGQNRRIFIRVLVLK
jgi:outer membrane protein OmpA-like peptidoglycan-associated protein